MRSSGISISVIFSGMLLSAIIFVQAGQMPPPTPSTAKHLEPEDEVSSDRIAPTVRTLLRQLRTELNNLEASRGAKGGIATLDNNGKVFSAQLSTPPIITNRALENLVVEGELTSARLTVSGGNITSIPAGTNDFAPTFGGAYRFNTRNNNGGVFAVLNDRKAGTLAFDTALTGYGKLAVGRNGNAVFGLFGRADLYAPGTGTNEVNSFNYTGYDAPATFPWDRGIGTKQSIAVALTVAAGGSNKSAAGIELAREGQTPNSFQYGFVSRSDASTIWNIYLDATANSSALNGIYSATVGIGTNVVLKTTGNLRPKNAVLAVTQADGAVNASITQDGSLYGSLLNLRQTTPINSSAPCNRGDITADTTAIYVCVAPSTWRKSALSVF